MALAAAASAGARTAAQSESERAAAVLAEKIEETELELHKKIVEMRRSVVDSARLARDAADKHVASVRGFPAKPDTPERRYKETVEGEALAAQRRAAEDVEEATRALQAADAAYARVRAKLEESRSKARAKAGAAAASSAAASAASAAAAAAPPQRFWELKGHELAHEPDGKQNLLKIVEALMDRRLIDDTKVPPVDRRGGTILIDEAHNLDPQRTPNGRAVLQYILTIAEDNKDVRCGVSCDRASTI